MSNQNTAHVVQLAEALAREIARLVVCESQKLASETVRTVSLSEAAHLTGWKRATIKHAAQTGEIPHFLVEGKMAFRTDDLWRWMGRFLDTTALQKSAPSPFAAFVAPRLSEPFNPSHAPAAENVFR